MRALKFLQRRRTTTTATILTHSSSRTNSLLSRCSVFASRNVHASTTVLLSSSSLSSSPATFLVDPSLWQKNLLILGGAGLVLSSYLYNSDNEHHVSRCDTKTNIEKEIAPENDADIVPSSLSATTTTTKTTTTTTTTTTGAALPQLSEPNEDQEDEETHCTICLINRQGPCRPYWRKFERCMKDSGKAKSSTTGDDSSKDENDSTNDTSSPTMAEKCDGYMMPWLTCVQSHRNTYTLIANQFFQDELVDGVENGIRDEDKVHLGGSDDGEDGSILPVDWKQLVEFPDYDWLKEEGDMVNEVQREEVGNGEGHGVRSEGDADSNLVEGVARINLWDGDGKGQKKRRRIDLAYVRDQNGLLLGHEQFVIRKSETEETKGNTEERKGDTPEKEDDKMKNSQDEDSSTGSNNIVSEPIVGHCVFHVCPETTKAIQIFALYGKDDDDYGGRGGDEDDEIGKSKMENTGPDTDTADKNKDKSSGKQTLYDSGLIFLSDLKPPNRIKDTSLGIDDKSETVDTTVHVK